MSVKGDYAQFGSAPAGDLPPGYLERRAAFAPDGKYGRWLLDFPVAIAYDDTLFLHGGVSGALDGLSLEDINEASRRDVRRFAEGWHTLLAAGVVADGDDFAVTLERAAELARPGADVGLRQAGVDITEAYDGLPFVRDGPLWYRGSVRCHPFTETEVAKGILEPLEVDRVVVGHTPTHGRRVVSRLDGRVIMLDTGMNVAAYRGRPAALILEDGEARAWYAAEGEQDIPVQPHRAWSRPGDMSDAELEDFLLTAEIAGEEPAAEEGAPRRLVLEKDGLQLGAVFNPVDTLPGLQDGRWTRAAAKAERYHHEIAAYRLDRLLGLQMVPVTVERQIGGQKGALRAWIEGSFSEEERQARQLPVTGSCGLDSQYELVAVFDTLIFNSGHDLGRLRYDREWQLWHMEQSRAFGLTTRNVAGMRLTCIRARSRRWWSGRSSCGRYAEARHRVVAVVDPEHRLHAQALEIGGREQATAFAAALPAGGRMVKVWLWRSNRSRRAAARRLAGARRTERVAGSGSMKASSGTLNTRICPAGTYTSGSGAWITGGMFSRFWRISSR
jgi:hypothetical protein